MMTLKEKLKVFNLDINYTKEDLKLSYKRLAKRVHPDTNPDSDKDLFITLTNIYQELNKIQGDIKKIIKLTNVDVAPQELRDEQEDLSFTRKYNLKVKPLKTKYLQSYRSKNTLAGRLNKNKFK